MRGSREHYALLTKALRAARTSARRPLLVGANPVEQGVCMAAHAIAREMSAQIPSFDQQRFLTDAGFGPGQTAAEAGQQHA